MLTGASGFFGSNLVDLLVGPGVGPGVELHVVQRRVANRPDVVAHSADLLDPDAVQKLISTLKPTHLCHMAWLGPEHQDRYRSPENDSWADASKHLFNVFAANGGQRLIHVGSCIEYGNAHSGVRTESQPLAADTAYGQAKADVASHVDRLSQDISTCLLYTSPSPRDATLSRMPSSA